MQAQAPPPGVFTISQPHRPKRPDDLDVHLIVDNYCTHKHTKVKRWLSKRPRYHVHFTPTYASWLNQVEIWFNIITQKAIRRGSFRSRERTHRQNPNLHRQLQQDVQAFRLDRHRTIDHPKSRTIL